MKRFLVSLVLLVSSHALLLGAEGVSLSVSEKAAVQEKAKALGVAFDRGDADAIIAGTHPAIFKLFGSREQFESLTRQSVKTLGGKFRIVSREWGEPTPIYSSGSDEVCFLPTVAVMESGEMRGLSTGFFIAARQKGTSDWLFLDGAGLRKDVGLLWKLFPELPKDIVLPPNKIE